jgi:hypothetical protein
VGGDKPRPYEGKRVHAGFFVVLASRLHIVNVQMCSRDGCITNILTENPT